MSSDDTRVCLKCGEFYDAHKSSCPKCRASKANSFYVSKMKSTWMNWIIPEGNENRIGLACLFGAIGIVCGFFVYMFIGIWISILFCTILYLSVAFLTSPNRWMAAAWERCVKANVSSETSIRVSGLTRINFLRGMFWAVTVLIVLDGVGLL